MSSPPPPKNGNIALWLATHSVEKLTFLFLFRKANFSIDALGNRHLQPYNTVYTHALAYIQLQVCIYTRSRMLTVTYSACMSWTSVSYSHTYSHIHCILYSYPPALVYVYVQLRSRTLCKQLSIAYCVYATNYACAPHMFMTTTCSSRRLLKIIGLFCKRAL